MGKKFTIRDFLNKLKWDKREDPGNYMIYYISRGAPGDIEKISADKIVNIYSRGFEFKEDNNIKYIPYHRIIIIKNIKDNIFVFKSPKYFSGKKEKI